MTPEERAAARNWRPAQAPRRPPSPPLPTNAEIDARCRELGARERAAGRGHDNTVTVRRLVDDHAMPAATSNGSANGHIKASGDEASTILRRLDERIAEHEHALERLQIARGVVAELEGEVVTSAP